MPDDDSWMDAAKGPATNEVAVDYIKSHDFRVVWVDGVIGGITPNGVIHVAVYAERQAIPRRQVFKIEPTGENVGVLGAEILEKQISRGSVVREMACNLFLTAQVAENMAQWLMARAVELRKITGGQS